MGVMLIPPEEAQDLAEVLSPDAADRMKNEGVYTLGDFNSAFQCTGCIQFTTEEEEGERSGRLLYLYVRPAYGNILRNEKLCCSADRRYL